MTEAVKDLQVANVVRLNIWRGVPLKSVELDEFGPVFIMLANQVPESGIYHSELESALGPIAELTPNELFFDDPSLDSLGRAKRMRAARMFEDARSSLTRRGLYEDFGLSLDVPIVQIGSTGDSEYPYILRAGKLNYRPSNSSEIRHQFEEDPLIGNEFEKSVASLLNTELGLASENVAVILQTEDGECPIDFDEVVDRLNPVLDLLEFKRYTPRATRPTGRDIAKEVTGFSGWGRGAISLGSYQGLEIGLGYGEIGEVVRFIPGDKVSVKDSVVSGISFPSLRFMVRPRWGFPITAAVEEQPSIPVVSLGMKDKMHFLADNIAAVFA